MSESPGADLSNADLPSAPSTSAVVYWRPGCPYCEHLMAGLDPSDERISYRNIWDEPDAAAVVRELQDGNELVPTVVVERDGGNTVLTAPDGPQVLAALA